ncbi:MAG: hypothetical protein HY785_15315 [Oscillatoriophycideae cyanobacterium NC_groundwater_1537_Pr4_S-0.65um_50_18]|nr:hypothetical protein [Oscillatoriophycideae cyanobacterium NC_groundwater_1537_Pr4_S-0.65um_50_18]
MNAVQAGDRPGLYQLSGQTNLPDKTQITVSAIRYLQKAGAVDATQPEATRVDPQKLSSYAILDRQFAPVRQGAWKTDLNLWQTADSQLQVGSSQADKPQEEWQLSLKDTNLKPLPEVVFLATVDPTQQPEGLQNQLDRLEVAQQLDLVRFTPDGEQYLQVSQTLAIPSPTAKAMTPVSDRTPQKVPVSQPNPASASDWKQISLPLSPDEFLQ